VCTTVASCEALLPRHRLKQLANLAVDERHHADGTPDIRWAARCISGPQVRSCGQFEGLIAPCCEPPPINNCKPLQLKLSFYKPEADQLVSVCPDSRCNSFGLASLSMSFRTFS
jgi:hypothetical protein